MSKEIIVQEITETTSLKMSASQSHGVTSYLLEQSSNLLRPDMSQIISDAGENTAISQPSNAEDIIRKLSEIVKSNENYIPISQEVSCDESPQKSTPSNLPECNDDFVQDSLEQLENENQSVIDKQSLPTEATAVEVIDLKVEDELLKKDAPEVEGLHDENDELLENMKQVIVKIKFYNSDKCISLKTTQNS